MSQISAREDSESPLARQHWLSENIPVEAWGDVLAGVHGMSDSLVTHLKAVAVDHQNGIFRGETDVVEKIGGRPPQALDEFIRQERAVFGAAEAVAG